MLVRAATHASVRYLAPVPPHAPSSFIRTWILATAVLISAAWPPACVVAQWDNGIKEVEKRLQGDTSLAAEIERELMRAGFWMVSPKAMPHLQRLDSLIARAAARTGGEGADWLSRIRAAYHHQMGYQLKFKRDIPGSLEHFRKAQEIQSAQHDSVAMITSHDAMGVLFQAAGEKGLAEKEFRQAMRLIGTTRWKLTPKGHIHWSNTAHIAYTGGHLIGNLASQGRMQEAARFLDSLFALDLKAPGERTHLLVQQANLHTLSGEHDRALGSLLAADSSIRRIRNAWDRLAVLTRLVRTQQQLGMHGEALATADTCIALANRLGDEGAECGCLVLAAQVRLATQEPRLAEQQLLDALAIAQANGYMGLARELGDEGSMVHITSLLKDLYRAQGRTADALSMTTLYAAYKDTLFAMEGREDVMRFNLHQQILADSLQKAEALHVDRLQFQQELEEERTQRLWIAASAIVALLLLSLLTISVVRRRRQERRIAAMEVQRLEQEKTIAELTIREQVGRDMHDDLGAGLSALRLRSEMAQRNEPDPDKREQFAAMARQAEELVTNMRQLIWSMSTEEGDLPGTVDHCVRYAKGYAAENGLNATMQVACAMPALHLTPHQRRNLFLTLKEALHNVVKHAEASEVRMRFAWHGEPERHGGSLEVDVHDNGRGMRTTVLRDGRGMTNMRKRMEELGGTIRVTSDRGVHVRFELPLA